MAEPLADRVIRMISQAAELYYRLVIVVAPSGSGKTVALQEVSNRTSAPLINVNLDLSKRMLDFNEHQRALFLQRVLTEIVNGYESDVILLDNIEVLFDVSFKQDPLRLLKGLSRNKTVVAVWSGSIDEEYITYATPGHLEHKRYHIQDFLVLNPDTAE